MLLAVQAPKNMVFLNMFNKFQLKGTMGKKTFSNTPKNESLAFSPVTDLVAHLPSFRPLTDPHGLMLKKTMIAPSICLLSIYGKAIEHYINHALIFPANNPKAFADQITKDVLGQVFPPDFHPEFNQYVSISSSLSLTRFEELLNSGLSSSQQIEKVKANQEEFLTHEIDAVIYVTPAEMRERWIEIKLFTCPEQSAKIISRLIQPQALQSYFATNDYLGLMGFSLICTDDGLPLPYQRHPPAVMKETGSWMIHLLLFDAGICLDRRSASQLGDWLLTQLGVDLHEMTTRLGLNTLGCFFRMTENFVKVVRMTQIIEEYKEELLQERKAREEERKAREEERKANQKKIAALEKELAKYKKSK
jgi:hypothetical protein